MDQLPQLISVTINPPVRNEDTGNGEGTIWISTRRELNGAQIMFHQIRAGGDANNTADRTGENASTWLFSRHNPPENPIPFFVRVHGEWSNRQRSAGNLVSVRNAPHAFRSGINVPNAERIDVVANTNNREFNITIGDGENHYILFDRLHEDSFFEIVQQSISLGELEPFVEFELVEMEFNGVMQPAIRVSGRRDILLYDRVMFNRRLYVDVASTMAHPQAGNQGESRAVPAWIYQQTISIQDGYVNLDSDLWNNGPMQIMYGEDVWYLFTDAQRNTLLQNYCCPHCNPGGFNPNSDLTARSNVATLNHLVGYRTELQWASRRGSIEWPATTHNASAFGRPIPHISIHGQRIIGWFQATVWTYLYGVWQAHPEAFANVQWIDNHHLGPTVLNPGERVARQPVSALTPHPNMIGIEIFGYTQEARNNLICEYNRYGVISVQQVFANNWRTADNVLPVFWEHGNQQRILNQINSLNVTGIIFSFYGHINTEIIMPSVPANPLSSSWDVFSSRGTRTGGAWSVPVSDWSGSFGINDGFGNWSRNGCPRASTRRQRYFTFFGLPYTQLMGGSDQLIVLNCSARCGRYSSGCCCSGGSSSSNCIRGIYDSEGSRIGSRHCGCECGLSCGCGRLVRRHLPYQPPRGSGNRHRVSIFGDTVGRNSDTFPGPGNTTGANIFHGNRMFRQGDTRRCHWPNGCYVRIYNTSTYGRTTLRWADRRAQDENFHIVPISRFTRFPIYVNTDINEGGISGTAGNRSRFIIDYRNPGHGVTSAPMPTLDTSIVWQHQHRVYVRFNLFCGPESNNRFVFNIRYEQRASHHLFDGRMLRADGQMAPIVRSDNRNILRIGSFTEFPPNHGYFNEFPGVYGWTNLEQLNIGINVRDNTRARHNNVRYYFSYINPRMRLREGNVLGANTAWEWF